MNHTPSIPARVRARLRRIRRPELVQAHNEPQSREPVRKLRDQVRRLDTRVEELERELAEVHSQGRRVAEISDLVTELLVSEASRRDPEFQRILDKYVGG